MCYGVDPTCSGNGQFNNATGLCECFPGYSSFGDMRYSRGHTCDVNLTVIYVFYGVALVIHALSFSLIVAYHVRQARAHSSWRAFLLDLSKPVTRTVHSLTLFVCFHVPFSALKLASEYNVMGMDLATTMMFFMWQIFLWLSTFLLLDLFVQMTLKGASRQLKMVRLVRPIIYIAFPLLTTAASLIVVSYFYQDQGCSLARACCYMTASCVFMLCLAGPWVFQMLIKDIESALEASRMQNMDASKQEEWALMLSRIKNLRREVFVQTLGNSSSLFVITSVPLFFNNLTYYEAVLAIALGLTCLTVIYNLTVQKPGSKGSSSGPATGAQGHLANSSKHSSSKARMADVVAPYPTGTGASTTSH